MFDINSHFAQRSLFPVCWLPLRETTLLFVYSSASAFTFCKLINVSTKFFLFWNPFWCRYPSGGSAIFVLCSLSCGLLSARKVRFFSFAPPLRNRFAHFHKYLLAMLVRFLFMMAHERDSPQNSSARAQSPSQRDESQSNNDSQTETQPSSHFENRNNSDRKLKSFSGSKQKK